MFGERESSLRSVRRGARVLAACLAVLGPWSGASVRGPVEAAVETPRPVHTVTGTLSMLDLAARKGMLKTDLDKPIFFEVGRPDHFTGVSIGDRVTVQLDEEGRTVKVIEALPAELHEPLPAPAP
jgi:hypothetical protein